MITVPTLCQRIEEAPDELAQLVNLLVNRMTGQESSSLTQMIIEKLKRDLPPGYSWPGNVRELEQAVRRILLIQGASAGQISTVSFGEERPAAFGSDEESYAQNRRVEIRFVN